MKNWYPQKRNYMTRKQFERERKTDPAPFVMALLGEKSGRLTEDDLTPPEPRERYKEAPPSFSDQVAGTLNPIIYALNKGKTILPGSHEHRELKELLIKANQ